MRVLLVMDQVKLGGAELSFFALCRSLSRRCAVHLALSDQSVSNPAIRTLTDSLSDAHITLHRCRVPLFAGTFANLHRRLRRLPARELAALIQRVRPDAVLVNLPSVERGQSVIDAVDLAAPRVPVWGFLHSSNPPSVIGAKLGWIRDRMVPALLRRFDHLLAVSASGADAVSVRYRAGIPAVLHPPISTPDEPSSAAARARARVAAGLPGGFLLGVIGRVTFAHKGQDAALGVTSRLRRDGLDVHLVVIGDGPDLSELGRLAGKLGMAEHVSLLGWRDDAAQLIPLLDAVLIPSRHEGMPLTAMQAAAASIPVVGYAVDGLTEFLPAPFRVAYGNEAGLAGIVASLVRGSLAWPGEEMRRLARFWSDPDLAAERLLSLLSSKPVADQPVARGDFEDGIGATKLRSR
jgi:glycosyltransferase involved in cell wall biosynthesis